jgi:hypothetical protein
MIVILRAQLADPSRNVLTIGGDTKVFLNWVAMLGAGSRRDELKLATMKVETSPNWQQ